MLNSFAKARTVKKQRAFLSIGAIVWSFFSSPAFSQQYWETIGTVNHVLRNKQFDGSQVINELGFITNQQGRVRILGNGQIHVFPIAGTILATSGITQYATMQVQGGDRSSFVGYAAHASDWGENIESYVIRPLTKSYVVHQNGSVRFYVAGQGWLYANGAWFGSDRNRKSDIHKIPKALDKVMKLDGVMFRWKEEEVCKECPPETSTKLENRTEIGLIAQDVEKAVPEVVRTLQDGTKAVAYQNLVALLIESTKSQQAQLTKQAGEIKSLQDQVKRLARK